MDYIVLAAGEGETHSPVLPVWSEVIQTSPPGPFARWRAAFGGSPETVWSFTFGAAPATCGTTAEARIAAMAIRSAQLVLAPPVRMGPWNTYGEHRATPGRCGSAGSSRADRANDSPEDADLGLDQRSRAG